MVLYKSLYAPYEPSCLRILSGPLSPASPLNPTRIQLHYPNLPSPLSMISGASPSSIKIVEPSTMPWIWSCHKCNTRYALGTTRRCLHDGHYFCGGTTVDRATGKTKRHRACASEFDYIGWESFNNWKREQKHPQNPNLKHCENQCDFPSACHWKTRHAPKKEANFSFLDPKCLDTEESQSKPSTKTTSSSGPELTLSTVPKIFTRIVKAAEKRTPQITTLLSTLEEESNFTSTPGYIPPSTSPPNPLTQQQQQQQYPPKLNPLSLHLPILDFSLSPSLSSSLSTLSETSTTGDEYEDESEEPDVDMTDWIAKDDIESPPISPVSPTPPPKSPLRSHPHPHHPPNTNSIPFDFSITTTEVAEMVTREDESPISPMRTVWEWTAGDIGIALSSPPVRTVVDSWSATMEDVDSSEGDVDSSEGEEEEGEVDMLWERDIVYRRISV